MVEHTAPTIDDWNIFPVERWFVFSHVTNKLNRNPNRHLLGPTCDSARLAARANARDISETCWPHAANARHSLTDQHSTSLNPATSTLQSQRSSRMAGATGLTHLTYRMGGALDHTPNATPPTPICLRKPQPQHTPRIASRPRRPSLSQLASPTCPPDR